MSPSSTQRINNQVSASRTAAAWPLVLLSLLSLLCSVTPDAARAQTLEPQAPATRPRTVGPKSTPTPTPTPAPPAESQPAPQDAEAVDEDEVVRVTSNLVIIPASVVDQRGRAVTDLKVEDFELKIDGEVKPIGDFGRAETPVHIALLFDNSESLSEARELEKQAAVRFFQSVVRPIDRAAVYSISTVPVLAQPLTSDVQRLVRTVENFGQPDGATALFDSIAQAADYMRAVPGRKVLVLVSDGTDTVSDVQFEEAVNRALRAECQVYVVQTRQVEDPSLRDTVSEQRMLKLSEQTGGAVYAPQRVEELDDAFAQISLDLSQQYLLGYYPQDGRKDKFFRFISVRVKTRPALRVRARKGFYPDAAQAGAVGPVPESAPYAAPVRQTREGAAGVAPAKTGRIQAEPLRKQGPAGPDDEERPRPTPRPSDAAETAPTFTLTTASSNVVAAAAPSYDPPPAITPTPVPTPTPRPIAPAPAANPEPTQAAKPPVSGGVLNAKAMSLPAPFYPQSARNAGAEGTVIIEVVIDEQGKVAEAHVLSGHPLLRPSALIAARQAKFTPSKLSGEPVRVRGTINYVFALPK